MKRKLILLFLLGLVASFTALAQTRTLRFIYIAHDENTISQKLIGELRNYYDDAINYPEDLSAVFYLTNGNYPIVVRVNTNAQNPKDFDRIVGELQGKRSHDVDIETDLRVIPEIFSDIETVGGSPAFANVEWSWYINSSFWELGYNESVIAALSWIMEMPELVRKGYLDLKFYYDDADVLPIDREHPFGLKNLMPGIKFIPMPY